MLNLFICIKKYQNYVTEDKKLRNNEKNSNFNIREYNSIGIEIAYNITKNSILFLKIKIKINYILFYNKKFI
jgi:hypothetical protein